MSDITDAINTGVGLGMTLGVAGMAMGAARRIANPPRRMRRKHHVFRIRRLR